MKLNNKVAVVTGASRGIGKSIAIALAQEGVHLALVARNQKNLASTAFACEQYGITAKTYSFDLAETSLISELVDRVKNDFKWIDILINDAGHYFESNPFENDLTDWDYTLDVNFKAPYHLTNEILKIFKVGNETAIVNISSISGLTVSSGGEIYNASKAALKSFGGCLFESVREKGIKVINIYPGYVNSSIKFENALDHSKMIQPQDIANTVIWSLSMPANVCPTDITIRPQFSPSKKAA